MCSNPSDEDEIQAHEARLRLPVRDVRHKNDNRSRGVLEDGCDLAEKG